MDNDTDLLVIYIYVYLCKKVYKHKSVCKYETLAMRSVRLEKGKTEKSEIRSRAQIRVCIRLEAFMKSKNRTSWVPRTWSGSSRYDGHPKNRPIFIPRLGLLRFCLGAGAV